MKIIYVNCGVKNYMKVDHRSCIRNFCKFNSVKHEMINYIIHSYLPATSTKYSFRSSCIL